MVLVIAASVLAVALVIALVVVSRRSRSTTASERVDVRLPVGADAALWSIVEAVPDPRNHLALTRDLTGEVRISGTVLDPQFRASTRTPPPRPTPAATGSVRIIAERIATPPVTDAAGESHLHRAS